MDEPKFKLVSDLFSWFLVEIVSLFRKIVWLGLIILLCFWAVL
jgi:hypothetical protein